MQRNKPREALEMVREAIALDPEQPEYLALCAWLTHQSEGNPPTISPTVEQLLMEALEHGPECERAHHYAGLLFKRAGRLDDALQHFAHALSLDPTNVEAERELRLERMRRDRSRSQPLLKRLLSSPPWKRTGSN
jgi:cytochrome c-type biogenesis protein CcmH/NrfG